MRRRHRLTIEDLDEIQAHAEAIRREMVEKYGPRIFPDLGPCPVPGCTNRAKRGWLVDPHGGFRRENKVYVCDPHVQDLQDERLAVDGRAPDALVWIAGEREVAAWLSAGEGLAS